MAQTHKVGKTATTVKKDSAGNLVVTYHATDVVTARPDGSVVLNANGWFTNTTRLRMNQAASQFQLGYSVFQKAGNWFATWKGQTVPFRSDVLILPA
jgi:allantoicase